MSSHLDENDTGVIRTREKRLTRRGVLWLGQTCNIRCHFCYFLDRINDREHPEHAFMDLEKAKEICHALRFRYGSTSVDIQGGEPTIWKHVCDLVAYCVEIGLQPTLITNAIALAKEHKVQELKAAGVRDLLISVQGLGDVYDEIVDLPGGSEKQMQAIDHCVAAGVPFRFNCVLSKKAIPQYADIARLAVAKGARVVNFLAFNPFEDQVRGGKRSIENVPRYSDVGDALNEALDILEEAGIEANVRYLPACMVAERHRKTIYNFQQLSFDPHEWDFDSWTWTGNQAQRMKWGGTSAHHRSLAEQTYSFWIVYSQGTEAGTERSDAFVRAIPAMGGAIRSTLRTLRHGLGQLASRRHLARGDELGRSPEVYRDHAKMRAAQKCGYKFAPACARCDARRICDGFHIDYAAMFGVDEAQPIADGGRIDDPTHFIRDQEKIYEAEESDRFERQGPAARDAA
ncbi:MAG: radical SAM protein [Bauldia litoralis]